MAPELLAHNVDSDLTKADTFSLGMTLFECASLLELPRNSMEDPSWEEYQVCTHAQYDDFNHQSC